MRLPLIVEFRDYTKQLNEELRAGTRALTLPHWAEVFDCAGDLIVKRSASKKSKKNSTEEDSSDNELDAANRDGEAEENDDGDNRD